MMKKFFEGETGEILEVYMDEMIVKSNGEKLHEGHFTKVFNCVQQYNMKLNQKKCIFSVKAYKFLGFYLTERGIKANPNKCDMIIEMETTATKERIVKLIAMLIALN